MLNLLIHFWSKPHKLWSKPHKTLIACLGLASLIMSCTTKDVTDASSLDAADSSALEEVTVTEESPAPQLTQASSEPEANISELEASGTDSLLNDLESGIQYADARARLLQRGWIPVEAPEPGPYGVERMAYDAGFTEVVACAGTGLGQCRFEFVHPDEQKALSVITYGGSDLEVGDWNIQSSVSAQAATPIDNDTIDYVHNAIPMQFQGEWNASLEGCGEPNSDGRLLVGLDQIEFYDSSGTVLEVMTEEELEMMVTSEYSSEGETFIETDSFQLSSDRSTLTDTNTGIVRYRCSDDRTSP